MARTRTLDEAVMAALSAAIGRAVTVRSRSSLSGGSICVTERLDTSAGPFVLKSLEGGQGAAVFEAEARGLEALGASGASLTIPRVMARSSAPPFLVIEYLDSSRRGADFDERLGRGLAELHRARGPQFGFTHDNFCGATPQPNGWLARWVDFYRERRLGYQVELAGRRGLLTASDRRAADTLLQRLGEWIDEPAEGPALVHGDLWSGNLHVDAAGRPALIDPAVHYAHREAELGMMLLFGGFSSRVLDAYTEAFPLAPGWRDRNALYQLYHLLNHLNLFGGSYHGSVMAAVHTYV